MKQPRDYQTAAHTSLMNYIHTPGNYGKNPLVVEATGLGKSLNIAMFIRHIKHLYPHVRIMQCVHTKELIRSNYEELMDFWPAAPAGIYSAGLKQKDTLAQITFCGIHSVAKRPATFGKVHFLLVDECHLISERDDAMYTKFIEGLRQKNPNLVVIGFTATDFRTKTGRLTEGAMFDDVVYDIGGGESFVWAVEQGYLIRPVPVDTGIKFDDSAVSVQAGDFNSKEASNAMHEQDLLERAVDHSISVWRNEGRRCPITFCQSIPDCEAVAEMFTFKGMYTEAVHSQRSDRDDVLAAYKRGEITNVTNNGILTTGFNHPPIDMLIGLRLTRSPGLWVQIVGRTTRPVFMPGYDLSTQEGRLASIAASHKHNARILDYTGNTMRLGPINYPNVPERRGKGGGGSSPIRICPDCSAMHHTSVYVCTECGYKFPPPSRLDSTGPSNAEIVKSNAVDLSAPPPPRIVNIYGVNRMTATRHEGRGDKLDTMKVTYVSGYKSFSKWVCIEHPEGNFGRLDAERWWARHAGEEDVFPSSIDEALEHIGMLRKPKFIKVDETGKYSEIKEYDFIGTKFNLPPEHGGPPLEEPPPEPPELAAARERQEALEGHHVSNNVLKSMGLAENYTDDEIPF